MSSKVGLDRKESSGSAYGRTSAAAAPPPYSAATSPGGVSPIAGKKAPPPPPPIKPKPGAPPKQYCTAIFDYEAQVSHRGRTIAFHTERSLTYRPRAISPSVRETASRSSSVPIRRTTGGLARLMAARVSSPVTTPRWTRCDNCPGLRGYYREYMNETGFAA